MIDQDLIEAVRTGMVSQQVKDRLLNVEYSEPYTLSAILAQVLHGNATIDFISRQFTDTGKYEITPQYDIRITGLPRTTRPPQP